MEQEKDLTDLTIDRMVAAVERFHRVHPEIKKSSYPKGAEPIITVHESGVITIGYPQ